MPLKQLIAQMSDIIPGIHFLLPVHLNNCFSGGHARKWFKILGISPLQQRFHCDLSGNLTIRLHDCICQHIRYTECIRYLTRLSSSRLYVSWRFLKRFHTSAKDLFDLSGGLGLCSCSHRISCRCAQQASQYLIVHSAHPVSV